MNQKEKAVKREESAGNTRVTSRNQKRYAKVKCEMLAKSPVTALRWVLTKKSEMGARETKRKKEGGEKL